MKSVERADDGFGLVGVHEYPVRSYMISAIHGRVKRFSQGRFWFRSAERREGLKGDGSCG
jgi:hypothetical protein